MKYQAHDTSLRRFITSRLTFMFTQTLLVLCLCANASAQDSRYKLVSPAFTAGQSGNQHSYGPSISADGRFIAFTSQATNLVSFTTSGSDGLPGQGVIQNVFIRDVQAGTTKLVSINRDGTGSGNGTSFGPSISADGRFVTFQSTSSDLVDNDPDGNGLDTFIRDTQTDKTTLVSSPSAPPSNGGGVSTLSSIDLEFPFVFKSIDSSTLSADGRYLVFTYSYDFYDTFFSRALPQSSVGRLDMTTGAIALLPPVDSVCHEAECPLNTFQPSVSADGRFAVFSLTNGGFFPIEAVILGDFATLKTTIITGHSVLSFNAFRSVIVNTVISADGRSVAFSTNNRIAPEDTNSFVDVYRFDHDPDPAGVNGYIQFGQPAFTAQEGGGSVTVPVLRASLGASGPATVQYTTGDLTANAGSDYTATSGALSFGPGEDVKFITVPVVDDNVGEGVESFSIGLSNPTGGYVVGPTRPVTVVSIHESVKPTLTISDAVATEGGVAAFTVTVSHATPRLFGVTFSTADNTANSGDYQLVNFSQRSIPGDFTPDTTLFFFPSDTTKTIFVHANRDTLDEPDETFFVRLTPVSDDYTIERAQAVGTIHNDRTPGVFFSPTTGRSAFSASEADGHVTVIVKRTAGDTSIPFSVNYATEDSSASERSDYEAAFGRLDFAPGELVKTFDVLINNDAFVEPTEDVTLTLSSPTNGAIIDCMCAVRIDISSDDTDPSAPNPLDDSTFFVTQHYHDFLNREPDAAGLAFWVNEIEKCGQDSQCRDARRVNVSAAFFLSIESQQTGFLVYKTYGAAFGTQRVGNTVPLTLREFLADTQSIGAGFIVNQGDWQTRLETNKQAYFSEFVSRAQFLAQYPTTLTAAQFVDALNANAGGALSTAERNQLVSDLTAGTKTRAQALRTVVEDMDFNAAQFNRAFVLMQYFGYLRRDPNASPDSNFDGYNFWLAKLNQFNGDFVRAEMVKAFITSGEYRHRFGQ